METNRRKIQSSWWESNWRRQGWISSFMLIASLLAGWVYWASSSKVMFGSNRDAEILTLITSEQKWEAANAQLTQLKQILVANPLSIPDPVNALNAAEAQVINDTKFFELAGLRALNGEMIVISGVMLQVITTLVLISIIAAVVSRNRQEKGLSDTDRRRLGWVERIRSGTLIEKQDEILSFVSGETTDARLSIEDIKRGNQVVHVYTKFLAKYKNADENQISWLQISNLLYELGLICEKRGAKELAMELKIQYKEVERIINREQFNATYSSIGLPILFLMVFTLLTFAWNNLAGPKLGEQLTFWKKPILLIGVAFVANGIVRVWAKSIAYRFIEKTWNNINDDIISPIIELLAAFVTVLIILSAIYILTSPITPPIEFGPFLVWIGHEAVADIWRALVVVLFGTWFITFFVNRIIGYYLTRWAISTGQAMDAIIVTSIQLIATFFILTLGIIALLGLFQTVIREVTGTDITTLLAIVVAVISAIGGYTSRFAFENFLSGLLMQIEKPFERGEKIVLPDGQICDVREVGMRSTVLYNVTENTEVSVPNSELANMIIKNTSRPGLELRMTVSVWIANPTQVKLAQGILLDISYLDAEIDQMRVFDDELSVEERFRINRSTIKQGMERLAAMHEQINRTIISQITGGKLVFEHVFKKADDPLGQQAPYLQVLNNIKKSRQDYRDVLDRESKWLSQCVVKVESGRKKEKETKTLEKLQDYCRAINEIAYSESRNPLENLIQDVAYHEQIEVDKLKMVLKLLLKPRSTKERVTRKDIFSLRKKLTEFEAERLGSVLQIRDELAVLENYIYAIGEQYPHVRPELDFLIGEMNKEPSVSSEYTDDGHIRLGLICFAVNPQRKFEILNKLNTEIGIRFARGGVQFK